MKNTDPYTPWTPDDTDWDSPPLTLRRYAVVRGLGITADKVAAYLPSNYRVEGVSTMNESCGDEYPVVVISGVDSHGWTMEKYVVPRLGSGMMAATEIDLSHPVMMTIPAAR